MIEQDKNEGFEEFKLSYEKLKREKAENEDRLASRALSYEQRLKSIRVALLAASLVGAIGAMTSVITQFTNWNKHSSIIPSGLLFPDPSNFATIAQVDELRAYIAQAQERLDAALRAAGTPVNSDASQVLEISVLKASVKSVDERLSVLERSISENPEKALSIPMLRKDQENMVKAIDGNKLEVSAELTRIYDQQKWILGGVGTVLFALVTALFSALFKMVFKSKVID